jgi:hypothetical protein
VLDVRTPLSPTLVGQTVQLSATVNGIAVSGGYAYVAGSDGALQTIGVAVGVAVTGTLALVAYSDTASQQGGLRIVDVADPSAPQEVGHFIPEPAAGRTSPQSNDVDVDRNGLIYLGDRYAGLDILEFTRP